MPLSVTEAERTLNLLWEFKQFVEDEEGETCLNAAISLLTGYCSEILPVITRNGISSGSTIVELECGQNERLGICLDAVTPQLSSYALIMISLIKPGSVSHRSNHLKAGDQVLKINGHSLAWASLRRARWLLETAQRSGKVVLEIVSSALKSKLKHSRTLPPSPFTLEPPPSKQSKQEDSTIVTAEVENDLSLAAIRQSSRSFVSRHSSSSSIHNHPSYAPSIGSRRSSQIAISSTVEVAAHIARETLQPAHSGLLTSKKRKVHKIHLLKGNRPLGLTIIGGKGSKYGDIGIFIRDIEVDGVAHRDGRLKINDELLMANGRSLVGLTHSEADSLLRSMPTMVQLVVATESQHPSGQTSLCSSRFSLSSIQERHVHSSFSPLANHNLSIPEQGSAESKAVEQNSPTSLEKPKDVTVAQPVSHRLLDTTTNDDVISPQQKVFSTSLKHADIPSIGVEHLPNKEGAVGKRRKKSSEDSTDSAPKKERSSSGTLKLLNIFGKKSKSKSSLHPEKLEVDIEMAQLEMSLGKSLEESETSSADLSTEHKSLSPSGISGDLEMVTPWARMSGNSLSPGNMPPSPPIKTVVIPRSQNKKLGIALGQSKNGSGPPFVKSLDQDGLAAKDGRVSVGSYIMKVNNELLTSCSAKDAAGIIRSEFTKYGLVSLMLSKRRRLPIELTQAKGMLLTVMLTKDAKQGLGIELDKVEDANMKDYNIVIQRVTSAENAQHVQRGDQVLEVNGLSLVGITVENVSKIFRNIKPGIVPFKIMRPENLSAVIKELDKLSNKPPQSVTSPLVKSHKQQEDIVELDKEATDTTEVLDAQSETKPDPPHSNVAPAKASSISRHSSMPDSSKPLALMKVPGSNLQESKITSSFESVVSKSSEDILRRLCRHPSIDTVKREVIEFEKGSGRMGIEVVAGGSTPHKGALVTKVFPDCIAGLEGKLKCGDELLAINGKSIIGMSHSEVINLLKSSMGLVTMLVSCSSQVLNSHSSSETSLLDDFYAADKQKSANTSIQSNLDNLKSPANVSLHSLKQEDFSEDELDAAPTQLVQQSSHISDDNIITIRYSDTSLLSGHRTSVIWEENVDEKMPPLPISSPSDTSVTSSPTSPVFLTMTDTDKGLVSKSAGVDKEVDGPPVGYSVVVIEIQKVAKGKLTIVPSQKVQEGYFMVRRFTAGSLKEGGIKPGDILVSLNGSPLCGITHAQVLQSLNEAPKQSKLEVYRDPDYKIDSVYSPRVSYARSSYAGSRSSLVSDDSPQLESRKGSITDFGYKASSRRSSGFEAKVSDNLRRSSEVYECHQSQETSSPKIRPSSLTSISTSISTIVAKLSSSAISPLAAITPRHSPDSSPIASHDSTLAVGYPVNILSSADEVYGSSVVEDATDAGIDDKSSAVAGEPHDIPMQPLNRHHPVKPAGDDNTNDGDNVTETTFAEKERSASVVFGSRSDIGPFEIEVTKGFWGIGITLDCVKTGAIVVKALSSRGPVIKDGNIKVGDHLLSINGEPTKSLVETGELMKRLPRGLVKIVAMPPPSDVANINWSQYILSPEEDTMSDEGISTVEFNRPKSIPLGINIAGGSDMPEKFVYIHSITPGSLADKCNKFKVGDEIVTAGNDLMIGLTRKAASDKIKQLVGFFKIVVQRRVDIQVKKKQEKNVQQNWSDSFDSGETALVKQKQKQTHTDASLDPVVVEEQHSRRRSELTPLEIPAEEPDSSAGNKQSITFTVQFNRPKKVPLGLNVAGGSDMPQKLIYIHSITPGSLADKCKKFKTGDEIVKAGNYLLAGLTWKAASDKINKLHGSFGIVAKRSCLKQKDDHEQCSDNEQTTIRRKDSFDSESGDELLLQQETILSSVPPKLPSTGPPKPPSSISLDNIKPAHAISVNSFDSESGDEQLLQAEESLPSVPLQPPPGISLEPSHFETSKLAHAISMDSFDSESGDEMLLQAEERSNTPKLPPELPSSAPPEPPSSAPPELPSSVPPKPPSSLPPENTKPAHAISMDSFDSESGDEMLLQEEALGISPITNLKEPLSAAPPKLQSGLPPQNAHTVPTDSLDKVSHVPKPSTTAPPIPSVNITLEPNLSGTHAGPEHVHVLTVHQQRRSQSSESGDGLDEDTLGVLPSSRNATKLSKNSVDSDSGDEATSASEEKFTVIFHKNENSQLGITIREDIDSASGVGIKGIRKDSLADKDGRLLPGDKLLYVNGINLCGMTYKKTLEVLRNARNKLEIVAVRSVNRGLLLKSATAQSSTEQLSDSEAQGQAVKVGEEKFTVEFHKEGNLKLGVTIAGGIDTPTGDVGVKNIIKGSLADTDGRLQQGNKLLSVNGISLSNVTNKKALEILRGAGNDITIVAVRYVGVDKLKGTPLSSAVPSLTSSRNQSPRTSRKALHEPLPEVPTPHRKMSKHFRPGKKTTESTSSLHESGHHTLPRDFGTVKAVELRKGPQGLGMQLIGGVDTKRPVMVKEIFTGGAAHHSGKIGKGDQILEINGKSFADLTHREVIEVIKNEPEGKVTLLVKFANRNK